MTITKEEFEKYEKARLSGVRNMFDVRDVELKSGLTRDRIFEIMRSYNMLSALYLDVRNNPNL